MRTAETVLGVIRERGRRGLPLDDVYRQLFNPNLYLQAYGRLYSNQGATTPGVTTETADGMSQAKILRIIEALRHERYRWTPVRRVYIEKKGSTKKRPLGVPTWSDKLLQEVVRAVLEAYYEPQFSTTSHGFRPNLGCPTALRVIHRFWKGTVWFIEGDVTACFDSLDHQVLLAILRERIHDNRFLRLIENLLKAGYLEDWKYNTTYSGTPQGGIVSPILANIYLDRLDKFVEQTLAPAYNRGERRRLNRPYKSLADKLAWHRQKHGMTAVAKKMRQLLRKLPSLAPHDDDYRRLRYVRYADDFLLGFTGPRHEAVEIKRQIGVFLRDALRLTLSDEKTLITHGRTGAVQFLGYEIATIKADDRVDERGIRTANGVPALMVPRETVWRKCQQHMQSGKPIHRKELTNESVFDIITKFQVEYQGFAAYYKLAHNRSTRLRRLKGVMEGALTKTLATKLRISVREVYARYGTIIRSAAGPRKVLRVEVPREGKRPLVAQWGAVSLKRQPDAAIVDRVDPEPYRVRRNELVARLLADICELCGSTERVEVHHVRALKDLKRPGRSERPRWVNTMAMRHRKTLVVCSNCHKAIHLGEPMRTKRGNRRAG
jgi:group II intron reverse transcriptase/maturase